jgi:hypothetical protein
VDQARDYHQNRSLMAKLRRQPMAMRMAIIFAGAAAFGFTIEAFACQTRLYESVAQKKAERRHELDEFVSEFREKLQGWQEEDKRRYEAMQAARGAQQQQQK